MSFDSIRSIGVSMLTSAGIAGIIIGFAAQKALGTLMAIGIMILPAASARFWATTLNAILMVAMGLSAWGCYCGLLLSYHCDLPASPAIVLTLGLFYLVSLLIGSHGSLLQQRRPKHHLTG